MDTKSEEKFCVQCFGYDGKTECRLFDSRRGAETYTALKNAQGYIAVLIKVEYVTGTES